MACGSACWHCCHMRNAHPFQRWVERPNISNIMAPFKNRTNEPVLPKHNKVQWLRKCKYPCEVSSEIKPKRPSLSTTLTWAEPLGLVLGLQPHHFPSCPLTCGGCIAKSSCQRHRYPRLHLTERGVASKIGQQSKMKWLSTIWACSSDMFGHVFLQGRLFLCFPFHSAHSGLQFGQRSCGAHPRHTHRWQEDKSLTNAHDGLDFLNSWQTVIAESCLNLKITHDAIWYGLLSTFINCIWYHHHHSLIWYHFIFVHEPWLLSHGSWPILVGQFLHVPPPKRPTGVDPVHHCPSCGSSQHGPSSVVASRGFASVSNRQIGHWQTPNVTFWRKRTNKNTPFNKCQVAILLSTQIIIAL